MNNRKWLNSKEECCMQAVLTFEMTFEKQDYNLETYLALFDYLKCIWHLKKTVLNRKKEKL